MPVRFVAGGGGTSSGGATNFQAVLAAGIALLQKVTGTATPSQTVGVAVSAAPATLLMQESVGVAVSQKTSGTVSNAALGVGVTQQPVLTTTPPEGVGPKIVQITYNLTGTYPASGSSSGGSWTNAANATGLHNATNATNANTLTVAASGALVLTYPAPVNKTGLTITNVTLNGYWGNSAGLVGPCTYLLEYSVNSGTSWTTIQTGSASVTAASPTTATNVTAAIAGSWTNVQNFQVRATYTGAASATASTLSIDAFELVVTANTTQTP